MEFTGCLAHVEVTYLTQTHCVVMIRGHLNHNQACQYATFTEKIKMLLHPDVFQHTLQQMKAGVPLNSVLRTNTSMTHNKAYPAMANQDTLSRYCFLIEKVDHRSIYRQYY